MKKKPDYHQCFWKPAECFFWAWLQGQGGASRGRGKSGTTWQMTDQGEAGLLASRKWEAVRSASGKQWAVVWWMKEWQQEKNGKRSEECGLLQCTQNQWSHSDSRKKGKRPSILASKRKTVTGSDLTPLSLLDEHQWSVVLLLAATGIFQLPFSGLQFPQHHSVSIKNGQRMGGQSQWSQHVEIPALHTMSCHQLTCQEFCHETI